jgi:hypothetical protein
MAVERGRLAALATQAQFIVNHREEEEDDNRDPCRPQSCPLGRLGQLRTARSAAVATWAQ